jgi:hypothetical protein
MRAFSFLVRVTLDATTSWWMLEEGGGRGAQGARRGRQTNCSKALVHEESEVPSEVDT